MRRFFAAGVALRRGPGAPGSGAAWARLRGVTRRARPAPRRRRRSHAASRPRGLDAVGFDWYDPVASHAMRVPGRRTAVGRA